MMVVVGVPQLSVFVSYSSRDRLDALAVRESLEEHGCRVWLDVFDIVGGERLQPQLSEALRAADVLCLLLSPTAVASNWVREEFRLAREHGVRVLPVVLRPCDVPDELEGLVGVSALDGTGSAHTRLQLVRAVLGREAVADVQIDQAFRALSAERAKQAEASPLLRETAGRLADLRQRPIRELRLELDANAVPPDGSVVLELVFAVEHDNLFTTPLSFFFAAFAEGRTWPSELGFEEPVYSWFRRGQARIDAWMRWIDRERRMDQQIDATGIGDNPAHFWITFDGARWDPGGPGLELSRSYELPSLAKLAADRAEFRLAAHYQRRRESEWIDPEKSDFGLVVSAVVQNDASPSRPHHCRLFKTGHDQAELTLLATDFLSSLGTAIEKETVLGSYPPLQKAVRQRIEQHAAEVRRIYESGQLRDDGDRRSSARLASQEASLHRIRGQIELAGPCLVKVTDLLEPLIFERELPRRADAELLIDAHAMLREFALARGHPEQAWACNYRMLRLADTMASADPDEPGYRRWLARALEERAQLLLEQGVWQLLEQGKILDPKTTPETTALCLREAIDIWRELHDVFASPATRQDLAVALRAASAFAREHELSELPDGEWAAEADRLKA
jgi:hypothetical protein